MSEMSVEPLISLIHGSGRAVDGSVLARVIAVLARINHQFGN